MFTPDPIAVGIPTDGDPILIDMSASITTNGMTNRLRTRGPPLSRPLGDDDKGDGDRRSQHALHRSARHDPADWRQRPWPQGLRPRADRGVADPGAPGPWPLGQAEPAGGPACSCRCSIRRRSAAAAAFTRETGWIAAACRDNPPAPGVAAVRLPGQQALVRKRAALTDGVALYPGIMDALKPWAEKLRVAAPRPLGA